MDKNFKVKVNSSFEYNFKSSDTEKLDLLKLSKLNFHAISNNKSFDVKLENSDFNNRSYIVSVNANKYNIKISNELDLLIKEMGFSVGSSKKTNEIKAPMPGMILNVNIKKGEKVKEGEILVILEAMKMENAIESPNDGIIKSIHIKNGETVEKGELMIELE